MPLGLHSLQSALIKRARHVDPYTPLLITMFGASILLFATCFATQSLYFVGGQLDGNTPSTFVTFGLFAICLNGATGKNCTDPKIGYQLDTLQTLSGTTNTFTQATFLPVLSGLPLHLVAFIFSILAMGIIIICCQRRNFLLSRWIFEIYSFVTGLVLVSYFIDISLFFSLGSKTSQPLFVGGGTWLTLVAFMMISFSGLLFKIHSSYYLQPEPLPLKGDLRDLEKGAVHTTTITDPYVSTAELQAAETDDDDKIDPKAEEPHSTAASIVVHYPDRPSEHSRTASSDSTLTTSATKPLAQSPTSESDPQLPQEVADEDNVEDISLSLPSLDWDGLRESTSSRGGLPSSRLLPDSERDELSSTRTSPRFLRDEQSPYAPSSYHTYFRQSGSSDQTASGLDGGIRVPDDQIPVLPSRASSCLNSPGTLGGKTPRSETRVSNRDLSRSGSTASNATSKSKRSCNRTTPQPSPLPKIPLMPMPSALTAQPTVRKLPLRPRIDTSHANVHLYPPLITAFANDSFTSLATVNSAFPSESALSTPQMSPVQS